MSKIPDSEKEKVQIYDQRREATAGRSLQQSEDLKGPPLPPCLHLIDCDCDEENEMIMMVINIIIYDHMFR